jgi:N-acetylneuraminate synthase
MSLFPDSRVRVIAEIGINHDGSLDKALEMIRVSAACGADFAKFQLLKADEMYSPHAGTYRNESGTYNIRDVVRAGELRAGWLDRLTAACREHGIGFLITVCDEAGLEEILPYRPALLKIASYEISHLPLFERLGALGIPIIFSTACARLGDIEEALAAYGRPEQACIMHCNGSYPAPRHIVNLRVLQTLRLAFPRCVIGFSDHTRDPVEAPVGAVALGARVIEKHITLDRRSPGPDHSFAIEPEELRQLVAAVHETERRVAAGENIAVDPILLGDSAKVVHAEEAYLRGFAYRSVFTRRAIRAGERFTRENLAVLRNGQQPPGLHPREFKTLLGRVCPRDLEAGQPVTWDSLLGPPAA